MKIVIDIPEEHYLNLIKTDENGEKEIPLGLLMSLWDKVKYNCTPLPKGHGDLISRQAVIDGINVYIEKAQSTGTIDDFISFKELVVKALPSAEK